MRIVFDLEADGLQPTLIWIFHAKDIDTNELYTFYPYRDDKPFLEFCKKVSLWVGHNIIGYDLRHLNRIYGVVAEPGNLVDTLVVSRLLDYRRPGGHSLEQYGKEFGVAKVPVEVSEWSSWNDIFIPRVETDVRINYELYKQQEKYITSQRWMEAVRLEHEMAWVCNELHDNGFGFDVQKGTELLLEIQGELARLSLDLEVAFPPRTKLVREVTPRENKNGTLSKVGLNFAGRDLTSYTAGHRFSLYEWEPFNPASALQRIDRLWEAGWKPTEKTDGHKEFEKQLRTNRRRRLALTNEEKERVLRYKRYGWKTSEENLATLPQESPEAAQTLVRWMLLRSRVSKLEKEWLPNVKASRIHGTFNGIGAWTQRMSHDNPNMGNVPKYNAKRPETTPYSDRLRALWSVPRDKLLVGVDAESIQLRVLAHYIDDEEFTRALVAGSKEEGTDPHSVNQRALGSNICLSRDDAKVFIYAWLLGAGIGKVAEILQCSREESSIAVQNFLDRYEKLAYIKDNQIPVDAANGYFEGIDGRYVRIFGEDQSSREHFTLAGYLQNGESIVMKRAYCFIIKPTLIAQKIPFKLVNFVHDEYQFEVPRDLSLARHVGQIAADAIRQVGEDLQLNCPLAGSTLNSHGSEAIGDNWMMTH